MMINGALYQRAEEKKREEKNIRLKKFHWSQLKATWQTQAGRQVQAKSPGKGREGETWLAADLFWMEMGWWDVVDDTN